MMTLTQHAWVAVWCMPVLPIVLLYCWSSLERGMFSLLARYVLRFWILRSLVAKLMDDQIIIGNLRKVHIWVPLQWFVTFTRISSGREKPSGEWRGGDSLGALSHHPMDRSLQCLLGNLVNSSHNPTLR